MASLLLISPGGMLGRAWVDLLERRRLPFDTARRPALDLTDPGTFDREVRPGHEVVINCGGYTDVDGAETHEAAAHAVNGAGVGHLARRCAQLGATLVHFSSDYAFDGRAAVPYAPDAPTSPINAYGRSKVAGEEAIARSGAQHLLVRTSWLYAPWGKNFVRTIARAARERDTLRVVDDQRGRPTRAEHLAEATLALLRSGARGCFHVSDGGDCTWYDLARLVAGHVRPACRVEPCATEELARPAPRPRYSVLDLRATEERIGPMPPFERNVGDVLRALEQEA